MIKSAENYPIANLLDIEGKTAIGMKRGHLRGN